MLLFVTLVAFSILVCVGAFVLLTRRSVHTRRTKSRPPAGTPTATTEQALNAIASFHKGAKSLGGGRLGFEDRGMGYEARVEGGKTPTFQLALTSGGGDYPAEFTPVDERRWEQRHTTTHQPTIALSWESRMHRLGERLGINRRVKVGDAGFDTQVHIATDAPDELVSDALREAATRQAIVTLLKAGFDEVTLFAEEAPVVARASGRPPHSTLQHKGHNLHVEALRTLGKALPPIKVERPGQRPPDVGGGLIVVYLLMSIFGFALMAFGYNIRPTLGRTPVWTGALWSVVFWMLSLPMLALVLRGRANAFHNLLVCALLAGTGYLVALPVALKVTNILFDTSAPRAIEARVLKTSSNSNRTNFYITFEPEPGPKTQIAVTSEVYHSCSTDDTLRLQIHEGALGWPWIREVYRCDR